MIGIGLFFCKLHAYWIRVSLSMWEWQRPSLPLQGLDIWLYNAGRKISGQNNYLCKSTLMKGPNGYDQIAPWNSLCGWRSIRLEVSGRMGLWSNFLTVCPWHHIHVHIHASVCVHTHNLYTWVHACIYIHTYVCTVNGESIHCYFWFLNIIVH